MDPKYYTIDSSRNSQISFDGYNNNNNEGRQSLKSLLTFFEDSKAAVSGGQKAPPVPPRRNPSRTRSSLMDGSDTGSEAYYPDEAPEMAMSSHSSSPTMHSINVSSPTGHQRVDELTRELTNERYSHQQTKHLLKTVTEDNKNQLVELNLLKARLNKLTTKLQKINIIYTHFQSVMSDPDNNNDHHPIPSTQQPIASRPITVPTQPLERFRSKTVLTSQQSRLAEQQQQQQQQPLVSHSRSKSSVATAPTHSSLNLASNNHHHQLSSSQGLELDDEHASKQVLTDEQYSAMIENRMNIALQILRTEKEYASHLSIIVEEFLNPMRVESYQSSNPFVTSVHVKQVFGEVEVILGSSSLLIEDLEKILSSPSNIGLGAVFLKTCDYFKLYSPYVTNYYTSLSVLNKLKEESHKFQTFIHEKEQMLGSTNFSDLGSLLVLPITRIGQYTTMLTDLYRSTPYNHDDYEPFKNAVTKMRSIVDYVKEKTREFESQNKVRIIQNQMSGKFQNLNVPHRRYVREGVLTEDGRQGTQYYCFLFNDIFIISTSTVKKNQPSYVFKREIKLVDAEVVIVSNENAENSHSDLPTSLTANAVLNGIINSTVGNGDKDKEKDKTPTTSEVPREVVTFCADSVRDREEWISNIQASIAAQRKKNPRRNAEEPTELIKGGDIDFNNSEIQLCEQIGSGGSGCTVHRCTVDGFTCAVKVLKLKNTQSYLIDQFVGEINIMVTLNHQNIAKYLGHRVTTNPERLWLFMEYYPFSLKDIISKRSTAFLPTEIVWMALEIAKGLEFLHNQKPAAIIHRDLKPGNIMCSLDDRNRVSNIRVCDFDTSKVLSTGVMLRTCIGTPCYMAPEVLDVSSTDATDGYTLKADKMILKGTPPPLPNTIPATLSPLTDLLHNCIDLTPTKRPSASAIVTKLTKLLKNSGKLQE
eukprot:gene7445-8711_t